MIVLVLSLVSPIIFSSLGNGSLPKFGGRTNGLFFSTKNSSPLGFFFKVNASCVAWHAFKENKKIIK